MRGRVVFAGDVSRHLGALRDESDRGAFRRLASRNTGTTNWEALVRSALVIFGAGLVLVACTSDIYFGGNPINMRSTTIGVGDYFFDPTLDTVPAGATVTW